MNSLAALELKKLKIEREILDLKIISCELPLAVPAEPESWLIRVLRVELERLRRDSDRVAAKLEQALAGD